MGPAHLHASLPVPTTDTCDLVCLNGGSCFLNARKQAKCRCQPRYNGDKCQIDQCWDYCQNGGTCAASPSGEAAGASRGSGPVLGSQAAHEEHADGCCSQACRPAAAPPASRGPGATSKSAPTTA